MSGSELVFIGGTGRSGTHALAQLLGRHSHLADVPIEARFHCNKRGMPDLLEGRITLQGYIAKLRGFWWHRVRVDGQPRGLYNLLRQAEFDAAIERFEAAYAEDPIRGCRELYLDLLEPVADRRGKPGLVEMSSHNIRASQTLLRLFPDARFIHALRDGRDSAASVTGKTWGPRRVGAAIGWWADRLRSIEEGIRGNEDGAPFSIPEDRFRVVLLEDLVGERRDATYADLLGFLGVDDEPGDQGVLRRRDDPRVGPPRSLAAAAQRARDGSGSSAATNGPSPRWSARATMRRRACGRPSTARPQRGPVR